MKKYPILFGGLIVPAILAALALRGSAYQA